MDDEVRLGYQAAVVSLGSPTLARGRLSVKPHPGNLLSCQILADLIQALKRIPVCGRKDVPICSAQRLQAASEQLTKNTQELAQRQQRLAAIQAELPVCCECWQSSELVVTALAADFQARGRAEKPYGALAKARRRARHWQGRYERQMQELVRTRKLIQRQHLEIVRLQTHVAQLQARRRRFEGENASNIAPVQAVFRLDAGFATWDNVALLIELGYEVYSRPYNQKVKAALLRRTGPASTWMRVGDNAEMIAWPRQQLKGCPYPVDIALERFYTGKTLRYGVLLHFGTDRVTADLACLVCLLQRQANHRSRHQGRQRRLPDAPSQGPQRPGALVTGTVCRFRRQLRPLGCALAEYAKLPGASAMAPASGGQCQNPGAGGCAHTRHRGMAA